MYMKFTSKDAGGRSETIVFDSYDRENNEDQKTVWVEMCPRCKEKYAGILGNRADDGGVAQGFCSVNGCRKEADFYVDFNPDEVTFEATCGGRPTSAVKKVSGKKLAEFLYENLTPGKAFSFYEAEADGKLVNERIAMMVSAFERPVIVVGARFGGGKLFAFKDWRKEQRKETFIWEFKRFCLEENSVDFSNLWLDTEPFFPYAYDPFAQMPECKPADLVRVSLSDFTDFIFEGGESGVAYEFQAEATKWWQRCMSMRLGNTKILLYDRQCYLGGGVRVVEYDSHAADKCKEWFCLQAHAVWDGNILVPPALGEQIAAYVQEKRQAEKIAAPESHIAEHNAAAKTNEDKYQYVVVCYAVHDREIASHDTFQTEEEAMEFLLSDARNTYEEESYADEEDQETIRLITDEGFPVRLVHGDEFMWTWEILPIRVKEGV